MAASDLRSSALEQTPSQRSSTSDVVTPHHPTAPHMGAASKPESRPAESKNLGDTLTSAQNPAIAEKQATLQQVKAELVEANATVARLKDRIARLTDQIAGQTGLSQRKTTSENTNSNGPTAMQQTQQQDASQPTDQATTTSRHDHPHTSALDEYYIGNGRSDDDVIDSDDSERNDSFDKERPRSRSQVATFHSLLEKRKNLPTRIEIEDRLDWIEHVRSVLEDEDVVEDFFKWMRAEIDSKAPYEKVTMAKFKSSLKEADWEKLNPASRIVTSKLCELYIDRDPQLYLGISKGFQTALRLNSRALILRDADLSICDFHNIEIVNPPPLLAMRYIPLDSSGEKQSLLFITLGNIFCKPIEGLDPSWDDTGFVLLLEIQENGKPGSFYVVYNLTDIDPADEPPSNEIIDWLEPFCGESNLFTVAKVESKDQEFLEDSLAPRSRNEIKLTLMSVLKPDIVLTGTKGDWSEGVPPVGLYPLD